MSATFPSTPIDFAHISYQQVRSALLARHEIALLDVREEAPHAVAHPLFAANLPLSQFELLIYSRVPRRDTTVVVLDDGEGQAEIAAQRLHTLGYSDISILEGGVRGWQLVASCFRTSMRTARPSVNWLRVAVILLRCRRRR